MVEKPRKHSETEADSVDEFDAKLFQKDALAYQIMKDKEVTYEQASQMAMEEIKKARSEEKD